MTSYSIDKNFSKFCNVAKVSTFNFKMNFISFRCNISFSKYSNLKIILFSFQVIHGNVFYSILIPDSTEYL